MRSATVVLPVPGLPVKLMCRLGALRRLQAEVQAQLVDHQQRGDVADALLDGRQADQVAVEFVEHRFDLALRPAPRRPCARRSPAAPACPAERPGAVEPGIEYSGALPTSGGLGQRCLRARNRIASITAL